MKIASIGAVYLDINALHFPIPRNANELVATETVGSTYEMVLGGSAVNFARFCKQLQHEVIFIGKTGNDKTHAIINQLFTDENITPALYKDSSKQTNINTNLVSDSDTSIMLSFGSANQSLQKENVMNQLEKHIDNIDLLYLGGVFKLQLLLHDLLDIIAFVKSKNKEIVLDHGRVTNAVSIEEKEIVKNLAKQCDYYLPSRDEFLQLWEVNSIEEGNEKCKTNTGVVIIKDGDKGAFLLESRQGIQFPAFSVETTNTIGAGDSFNAGFITALGLNKSLPDSVRFANATAALKISHNEFPTIIQVQNLTKTQQNG